MKTNKVSCLLAAGLLAFAGCGHKQTIEEPPPYDVSGVQVDIPKLQQAFATSPDKVKLNQALMMIRYGQYAQAQVSLEKMVANPALNEQQKKSLADVVNQMKQVVAKAGPVRN